MHSLDGDHDFSAMLDLLTEGIVEIDTLGVILYMNAAAAQILEVDRREWQGRLLSDIPGRIPAGMHGSQEFEWAGKSVAVDVSLLGSGRRVIRLRPAGEGPEGALLAQARAEFEKETERRKKAETALENQQEFLQALLDNLEDGIVACDAAGNLALFNNATRAFHGIPETPIPPDQWAAQYDLYYPDGITRMRKEDIPLYRAWSGEVVRKSEVVIAPKNGQRRTLLASGRALRGRDGRKLGAVVVMHDITHRKLSTVRLWRALRQFDALFKDAPIAYHEVDRNGILRRVNRAECRLLRRSRQELLGRPVWEFVFEEQRGPAKTAVLEKLSGRCPLQRGERQSLEVDGKYLVVEIHENLILDSSGEISGIRTAMLDVTDRQEREEKDQALIREIAARENAEAASAEIKSILERIGDAYIAFDSEWRYTYVNRKAAELALKPAAKLLGRSVWEEFPEAVHTPFYTELHRAMREQIPLDFKNYFAPLDKWFENSVYPSPFGVGVFYRDITERLRTERALEKRTAELARKNAGLETFAYIASHDLQEPLRMIGGYAGLLTKRYGGKLDPDADEFIGFITEGVKRMQRLIRNLLALCRLEEAGAEPLHEVSMAETVDVACANLELTIEDTQALVECSSLPVVRFNETQLIQVMQNLIGNALKYRSSAQPRIRISAERGQDEWTVAVNDNGIGLEMRYADQIFRPFTRLHRDTEGGTGIGLAICKKVVESRGGRIWVESIPDVGSAFFFTIPDAAPPGD